MQSLLVLILMAGAAPGNALVQKLELEGVQTESGAKLRLPGPTMPDGLDRAAQQQALATIADANRPLEDLVRRSVVAPFVLKMREGQGTGRRVDLWFVAYGDFQRITSEKFLKERLQNATQSAADAELPSKSTTLSAAQLAERGLTAVEGKDESEAYSHVSFGLFDRVFLSLTSDTLRTQSNESVLIASVLDPRFSRDAQFPNFWQSLERDEAGKLLLGAKHSYSGLGSYAKITRLIEPAGALFVECHIVFDEPQGWFGGANLLRSKLPILVQDNVRKFRREIR